jgi:uncharacterized oxidoreductase
MKLTGRTILVTGGTSGIGRALAEQFHRLGNDVLITGRRTELLDAITRENPGMRGFALDVQEPEAIARLAEHVRAELPALDVLVNNAGIAREESWNGALDLEPTLAMIETNITSVLRLTAALVPTLIKQNPATIITTSSGLAFTPRANYATYSATKAFLHSWLQSLRHQLRNTSVEVLELAPPYVQTELGGPAQARDPHAMPLADYTAEVMELLRAPSTPDGEILVERVKAQRNAERTGTYAEIYRRMNPL